MWDSHKVRVSEANEALADPDALWIDPDPASASGESVRVIGMSYSRRHVISVILVRREDGEGYWGANGWLSNTSDQRRYREGQ
jgi:uncharacterized DUF497 family protein